MHLTIDTPAPFRTPKNAAKVAADLQKGDPDWTYKVVDHGNGWASVEVYDEDGKFVARA